MDMKNTVILLIFLLSVMGLIIGAHYTTDYDSTASQENGEDISLESQDNIIIIQLEKKENEISLIDRMLV